VLVPAAGVCRRYIVEQAERAFALFALAYQQRQDVAADALLDHPLAYPLLQFLKVAHGRLTGG